MGDVAMTVPALRCLFKKYPLFKQTYILKRSYLEIVDLL